jgi:hypothetical protein
LIITTRSKCLQDWKICIEVPWMCRHHLLVVVFHNTIESIHFML